jgi:hypothetical protein
VTAKLLASRRRGDVESIAPRRHPCGPANALLPWLIYNASGAPLGVHRVERTPSRRNMVVVRPSVTLENLVANHGLLPRGALFGST